MEAIRAMFDRKEDNYAIPTSRVDNKSRESDKTFKDLTQTIAIGHGRLAIFFSTILYVIIYIANSYVRMLYLKRSEINVFYIWLQSGLILVLVYVYNYRKRRRLSFFQQARRLKALPLLCLYVGFIAIDGTSSNGYYNTSGGKEVHQLGMAVSPLAVVMATLWYYKNPSPTIASAIITICSALMMVLFCSENDIYIPYKITFMPGLWGVFHGFSLALFALSAKHYLQEMSISELVHSMNFGCLVVLPFVMFMTGELTLLFTEILPGQKNIIVSAYGIAVMAIFQLVNQVSCLHLVNTTSPQLYIASRAIAWVPVTLITTFAFIMELLVSSFQAFFLAIIIFLASLIEELVKPKTPQ